MKARKVRIYPTRKQRTTIDEWIRAARWTYNQCVAATRDKVFPMRLDSLRARYVNDGGLTESESWIKTVPYDVRDGGARDLVKAHKACLAKNRARASRGESAISFDFKFRRRKDRQQSIQMLSKKWNLKTGMFKDVFTPDMRAAEPLPDAMPSDGRLVREWTGRYGYYFVFPEEAAVDGCENQAPEPPALGVAAVDPGVRCFATIYAPEEHAVFGWGDGDVQRLYKLAFRVDGLRSAWSRPGVRHAQRYRMRRLAAALRARIRRLVDELHKKLAAFLCKNFRVVLLPEFATSGMVSRRHRKIGRKTARGMLNWAHFRFRQRLLNRAQRTPWCKVVICDEAYTSRTCGRCGVLNQRLGGNKTFRCPACGIEIDRDANGARNIMLKWMSERGLSWA